MSVKPLKAPSLLKKPFAPGVMPGGQAGPFEHCANLRDALGRDDRLSQTAVQSPPHKHLGWHAARSRGEGTATCVGRKNYEQNLAVQSNTAAQRCERRVP